MTPRILIPSLALALLAGCAAPYRSALAPAAIPQMSNTSGVVAVAQHEIGTSINSSNMAGAAGGGILFALVDAAVNANTAKKTERFAADLRQSLLGFHFAENAARQLGARFAPGEGRPFALATVVAAQDKTDADLAALVAQASGDAVLVVFPKYFLDPQFTYIVVSADVVVCAKSAGLRKLATEQRFGKAQVPILYRNGFQTTWGLPASSQPADNKRENNIAAWAANDGQATRDALAAACTEIAAMVQWDLAQPAKETYKAADKATTAMAMVYYEGAHLPIRGNQVHASDGRIWVQNVDGRLYGLR